MIRKDVPEDWVEESRKANLALFSELNALLKALDRFFGYEEIQDPGKNFFPELNAAKNAILRVIDILEAVIPEDIRNAYWFQKYAQTKLLTARRRDLVLEELFKQDTKEKSFYILYDAFINLKTVINDLLKNNFINYTSYRNVGQIVSKQIRENVYLNPFRQDMDPELDGIENREISDVVRNIRDRELKKAASIIFLQLFRFLRYLRHMEIAAHRTIALHSSMLILLLVRSEIATLLIYLEKASRSTEDKGLLGLFQTFSYQFSMETKRVYRQELREIFDKKSLKFIRGKIENGKGILKNLTEQTVVQLARHWKPELEGESIFQSFITKTEQSLKLREDIFALERLLNMFESATALDEKKRAFESLRGFMEYFERFTFILLRHDDYEEFAAFFEQTKTVSDADEEIERYSERCRHFRIFLNTTLRQIANRSELIDRPLDTKKAEEWVRQNL